MLLGARQFVGPDKGAKTARDYVQNGLISMFDGIENVGFGQHDSSSTVWVNLSSANNLTLINNAIFDDNSVVTADRNKLSAKDTKRYPCRTVEVVVRHDPNRNPSAVVLYNFSSVKEKSIIAIGSQYCQIVSPYKEGDADGGSLLTFGEKISFSGCYGEDGSEYAYLNARKLSRIRGTNYWSITGDFAFCGSTSYASWTLVGNVYAIRMYDRVLSPSEIAANYAVDKERFGLE